MIDPTEVAAHPEDLFSSSNPKDELPIYPNLLRPLLEKLYLLAELKVGKTLSVGTMSIVPHDFKSTWGRWWYGEGRNRTLDTIFQIIDEVKVMFTILDPTQDEDDRKVLFQSLHSAKEGIQTLLVTYQDDAGICARVNTVLAEIQGIYRKYHPVVATGWSNLHSIRGYQKSKDVENPNLD